MIAAGKVRLGQALLGITDLNPGQHVFCILTGLSVIPFHFAVNEFVDIKPYEEITINIETEDPDSQNSLLLRRLANL